MDRLIAYPHGTDEEGISFECVNGFVSRVVSSVADFNIPDAMDVAEILNAYFEKREPHPMFCKRAE